MWFLLAINAQQKPHYTQYILNQYIVNPAITGIENYIDVKLNKILNAPITLRLTDLTGKFVATSTFNQSSQVLRFNLQNKNFNTGIYLLTVETADRSVTLKVMHQ